MKPQSLYILSASGQWDNAVPSVRGIVAPAQSRRMGALLKRAIHHSMQALATSGIGDPDGIITATARGSMADTERFLTQLHLQQEEGLQPTPFMHSTHNTVSSQLAILLGCHGYNATWSDEGTSLATALLDAASLVDSGEADTLLVGQHDEFTPWTRLAAPHADADSDITPDITLAMVLSSRPAPGATRILRIDVGYGPDGIDGMLQEDAPSRIYKGHDLSAQMERYINGTLDTDPALPATAAFVSRHPSGRYSYLLLSRQVPKPAMPVYEVTGVDTVNAGCAIRLDADSELFKVHFPGNPILPGAMLLQTISHCAGLQWGAGDVKVKTLRFLHPVTPAHPCLTIAFQSAGPHDHRVTVSDCRGAVVAKGRIDTTPLPQPCSDSTQ